MGCSHRHDSSRTEDLVCYRDGRQGRAAHRARSPTSPRVGFAPSKHQWCSPVPGRAHLCPSRARCRVGTTIGEVTSARQPPLAHAVA